MLKVVTYYDRKNFINIESKQYLIQFISYQSLISKTDSIHIYFMIRKLKLSEKNV